MYHAPDDAVPPLGNTSRLRRCGVVFALVFGMLAAATSVRATTADDICPSNANPCTLTKGATVAVDNDSILDFGNRAFVLPSGNGTRLDIGGGSVTIHAASVTLNAGSSIIGSPPCPVDPPFPRGGTITIMSDGDLVVLRDGNSKARIDVSNCANPGSIFVQAGGSIRIEGTLSAQGTQSDAGFATIDLSAANQVLVPGDILAGGGSFADGGDLFVHTDTGDINVSGIIDVSGGNGGTVSLNAGSRIVTSEAGLLSRVDGRATAGGGTGGILDLNAVGDVSIASPLHAQGEPDFFLGGDGGEVLLTAGGTIALDAPVNLFGTVPDGVGGDADMFAELDIVQTGAIDASGKRSFGLGGLVDMLAQRELVAGSIDVSADCEECGGGELALEAWCSLTVPANAVLSAVGPVGLIGVRSGGPATIRGTLRGDGTVEIAYNPSAPAPDIAGATIVPSPTLTADPQVTPCGGPGECNHNGVTDEGEECDDGNDVACDACSNSCKLVVCGDGRLDAPCEECDDGNTNDCDGCRGDCSRADHICGDAILECGEACDPGSATACDAPDTCSASCEVESCGNHVVECGEECDDGAANGQAGSLCASDCTRLPPPNCGNASTEENEGEQCDDGNTLDCDDCNHLCETEGCGNNVRECLEECDDGNTSPCDGCTPTCEIEACGNGRVDCGEECDDGEQNGQPGSTCLPGTCHFGQSCTTESEGPCIPCADALDCDPLGRCGGVACVEGVCTPAPLACDDENACTLDGCDALTGCTHVLQDVANVPECDDGDACTDATCADTGCVETPKTGFDAVRCRLADLAALIGGTGLDEKAQKGLGKLEDMAAAKVETAATTADAGKTAKAAAKLGAAAKKLARFGKKVTKLQPTHITDPSVGARLAAANTDALARIDALRTSLHP